TDGPEPPRSVSSNESQVSQGLHVLYKGRPAPNPSLENRRGGESRQGGPPTDAADEAGFLPRKEGCRRADEIDRQSIDACGLAGRQGGLELVGKEPQARQIQIS